MRLIVCRVLAWSAVVIDPNPACPSYDYSSARTVDSSPVIMCV